MKSKTTETLWPHRYESLFSTFKFILWKIYLDLMTSVCQLRASFTTEFNFFFKYKFVDANSLHPRITWPYFTLHDTYTTENVSASGFLLLFLRIYDPFVWRWPLRIFSTLNRKFEINITFSAHQFMSHNFVMNLVSLLVIDISPSSRPSNIVSASVWASLVWLVVSPSSGRSNIMSATIWANLYDWSLAPRRSANMGPWEQGLF